MIERAAKMADWLRGTYGYSPEMNAKCVQLLKDMVEEMERLKAERDALKADIQAVSDASELACEIMRKHEQVKRTMSNDNVNDNVRAILDEIRAFKREAKDFTSSDYRTGYLSALSALEGFIAGLPAVGVSKWISVEERLPDKKTTVLFATRNNPAVYRGRYIATGDKQAHYFTTRIGRANSGGTYAATHWMPLPELPEEDA